jgi:2,3-bisphosphoglycerate-dependent phosphoglycerate mutase
MQLYFIRHGESANNALYAQTGASVGRSEDPELTPTGRAQALHLAIALAAPDFCRPSSITRLFAPAQSGGAPAREAGGLTHLYTSLMLRAVATGAAVAETTGLALTGWADLHEGGGIYLDLEETADATAREESQPAAAGPRRVGRPGATRAYFASRFPRLRLPPEAGEDGWWNRPYEPPAERVERAGRVLRELLRRHGRPRPEAGEDRVAFISHGGFYNYFMRAVLKMPVLFEGDDIKDIWFEIHNTGITRLDYWDGHFLLVYQNRTSFLPPELIN